MKITLQQLRRFTDKVKAGTPDECWEWQAGKQTRGYGQFKLDSQSLTSHRIAYQLANGKIPEGQVVRHTCDNPSCCNPNHLELGTQADNMRDMRERDRAAKGETHGQSKLTEDDIRYIRSQQGLISQRKLAKKFDVTHTTISEIMRNVTWKHI